MWPILELRLGQNRFEELESRVFERITLHVDIDECAYLPCAPEKRPEFRTDVCYRVRRSTRGDLRIQGGDFDGKIYNWKNLSFFSEWVCPLFCFAGQLLQQVAIKGRVFVRLGFAHNSFAQNIHSNPDFLSRSLAQCGDDFIPISPRDKRGSHFGNIPPQ